MFGWGATLHPFYNGAGAYGVDGTYRAGLAADGFWASLGKTIPPAIIPHILSADMI